MGVNKLPEKLTMLRKYHGYSQGDIAGKLGVTVQEYMNWENGNTICSIYQLKELAELFHVNVTVLADNTKVIVLPKGNDIGDSVAIPFQRTNHTMTEDLDIADNMLPVDGVVEEETTRELGRTRIMSKDSFTDTENMDMDDYEEEEERPHHKKHSQTTNKQNVSDKKKKQTIIIGSAVAAVIVILLVVILFLRGGSSSVSLSSTNRLAVGDTFSMYIDKDGKLKTRGNVSGTSDFTDLVQVSAFDSHAMGLTSKGKVVSNDDADVSDWSNVTMVAAGKNHSVALKSDGTVYCTGDETACAVDDWSSIKAVYAGDGFTIGLKNDGTVKVAGSAPGSVADATAVSSIAVGNNEVLVINTSGQVTSYSSSGASDVSSWSNISIAAAGNNLAAGVTTSGTVVATTGDEDMKNTIQGWNNIRYIAANGNTIIAVDKSGRMHGAGDNTYNQYENEETNATASAEADKLSSPSNLKVETSTGNVTISWDKVKNVDYYEVTVNSDTAYSNKTTTTSVSIPTSQFTEGQSYTVDVIAFPKDEDKYSQSDPASLTFTFTPETIQLDTPTNVTAETVNGEGWVISWDEVSHADYYELSISGDTAIKIEDGTSYTITAGLTSGESYSVSITACSNSDSYTDSQSYSGNFTYTAPTFKVTLSFSDGTMVTVNIAAGTYRLGDLLVGTEYADRISVEDADKTFDVDGDDNIQTGVSLK